MVGCAGCADYIPLAYRTMLGHLETLVSAGMRVVIDHFHDFGNHAAAALHLHPVADSDPEAFNLVHVVQGRARDCRAADRHRLEPCHRSQFSSAAHLRNDVFNLRDAAASRVLVSDGPARSLACESQFLLKCRAVHFYDDAVDLVCRLLLVKKTALNKFPDFTQVFRQLAMWIHFETGSLERVHGFGVADEKWVAIPQLHVLKKVDPPFGCDAWF